MTNPHCNFREARAESFDGFFADAIARLHFERRYRTFADLERMAGRFPHAMWHSPQGSKVPHTRQSDLCRAPSGSSKS